MPVQYEIDDTGLVVSHAWGTLTAASAQRIIVVRTIDQAYSWLEPANGGPDTH